MSELLQVDRDAWSDGQFRSKLWLCEKLEALMGSEPQPATLWIWGSWYGLIAQMLLIRGRLPLREVHLFDIDPEVHPVAMRLLDHWKIRGPLLRTHCVDCLKLSGTEDFFSKSAADILVNTSCEHFESNEWIKPVWPGTLVVAQSTDMIHPMHINRPESLAQFADQMAVHLDIVFHGELPFDYPNFSFSRFMVIGRRR